MVALKAGGLPPPDAPPPERRRFKLADVTRPFKRRVVNERKLAELQADVERRGLLDPPHVTPDGAVLSGNMRVEALLRLGVEEVECLVVRGLDTRLAQLAYVMSADVKSDVSRADQALRLATARRDHPGVTQKQVAAALGLSEATVSRLCSLLELPDDLVDAVIADRLQLHHVVVLARVKDKDRKVAALRRALADGTTPKQLARELKPSRRPAAKTHAMAVAGVTVTWPSGWPWPRLDAALGELRNYLRGRVKTADLKRIDLPTVLDAAEGPPAPPVEGGAG